LPVVATKYVAALADEAKRKHPTATAPNSRIEASGTITKWPEVSVRKPRSAARLSECSSDPQLCVAPSPGVCPYRVIAKICYAAITTRGFFYFTSNLLTQKN
jgi:hypothetical protein